MRIDGWVGGSGGCEWYRVERPLAMLQTQGHTTQLHRPTMDPKAPDSMDVLITQRLYTRQHRQLLSLIKGFGRQAIIADFDDDLWRVPRQSPASSIYGLLEVQDGLREYARMADVITVSTEPLRDRVEAELRGGFCPPVVVIPNAVPDELFARPLRWVIGRHTRIGWSGSDTHEHDWMAGGVAGQVDRFLRVCADRVEGVTMGAHYLRNAVEKLGWTTLHDGKYYDEIARFDIGLAPLARTALNDSKSHIKALEYMALGVLPLVSESAAYAPLDLPRTLTVQPGDSWVEALQYVTTLHPTTRRQLLVSNRHLASRYAESEVAPLWAYAVSLAHEQFQQRRKAA